MTENRRIKNKPKAYLKNIKIDEVSLCSKGMNEGAEISLWKSEDKNEETVVKSDNSKQEDKPMVDEKKTYSQEELDAQVKKAQEEKDAEIKKLQLIASLTDMEKSYFNSLKSDEEKDGFLKMDSKARTKVVQKAQDSDESLTIEGEVIRKSDVGDAYFKILKAQQARIEKSEKAVELEKAAREKVEFEKAAESQYPNLPGTIVEKGRILKAVASLDKETQESLHNILKAANTAMKDVFVEKGVSGEDTSKPEDKLDKMAKEYAEQNNVSYAKAYSAILKTDEGNRLYAETTKKK